MLLPIISLSLFVVISSSPSQNRVQEIMRHLQKSEDKRIKTETEQKVHSFPKFSDDLLNEVLKDSASVAGVDNTVFGEDGASKCACRKYNCGCCVHLKWDVIKLNDIVCVNFSYLPAPDYGISLTLTVDNRTIYNNTVSVRNPPALCVDIPYLKKYASLCVKFEDLRYSKKSLSGCIYIVAELVKVKVEDIKLGCFEIPPKNETLIPRTNTDLQNIPTPKLAWIMGQSYKDKPSNSPKLLFEPSKKHNTDIYALRHKITSK